MKVQKTISLTADTLAIAARMSNFSGWIRAMIRQYDEKVDPVEMELMKEHYKLLWKTISAAINEQNDEISADIWHLYNDMVNQRRLEDFE